MLEYVREGDCVVVHSMDRLARSLHDLEELVTGLNSRGVTISFLSQGLTFTGLDSPMNTLMLQMLGAVSQFERALILERQREGIAIAKAKGNVYRGRKPTLDRSRLSELRRLIDEGVSKSEVAAQFGISRTTLYSYLNQCL
jgi:DNA invertase Pin-like site-specific DNA recombinase